MIFFSFLYKTSHVVCPQGKMVRAWVFNGITPTSVKPFLQKLWDERFMETSFLELPNIIFLMGFIIERTPADGLLYYEELSRLSNCISAFQTIVCKLCYVYSEDTKHALTPFSKNIFHDQEELGPGIYVHGEGDQSIVFQREEHSPFLIITATEEREQSVFVQDNHIMINVGHFTKDRVYCQFDFKEEEGHLSVKDVAFKLF